MSILHKVIVPCLAIFLLIGIIAVSIQEFVDARDREERRLIVIRAIVSVVALGAALVIFYVSF